ncbi:YycH family regulatory protein [Paenibacillus larvae]|uniref:YycH family regulatory protein n=1 Tax=Paenibacillus larvae TaxID=1464 RepID=UPI00227FFFF0|nr:two-component system activity regulator YycH [Paenibacillus larvae]MCY7475264.1 YycH family regulatory protein [Paenibacillus larvae]MDE5165360.1 two-component system activity regulator YycH [Paenibacillus larvae subsp. larvae]
MMEKVKTTVLAFLVGLSLLQTLVLSYSNPNYDPIPQNDYVKTEPLGSTVETKDLLFPDQIVLHLGNQAHTVLYPNIAKYYSIGNKIKGRTFEDVRRISQGITASGLEDARTKQPGIELRFSQGISLNILQKMFQFKGDMPQENTLIGTILIYLKEDKQTVKTLLFPPDSTPPLYEVNRSDFSAKDFSADDRDSFIAYQEESMPYHLSTSGDFYLPDKEITLSKKEYQMVQFTAEQLKSTLFVDPIITRNLTERDGSQIYTDGKKGLQITSDQRWMIYSDPVAPVEAKNDAYENLQAGVRFINQHGGWNGRYKLVKPSSYPSYSDQTFEFAIMLDGVPIFAKESESVGIIRITVQKGIISNYERSMINTDMTQPKREEAVTLQGGQDLEERIRSHPKKPGLSIVNVFVAYQAEYSENGFTMMPVWMVQWKDGSIEPLK